MLRPFPISRFGGLKLDAEADEVGPNQALDLLDVEFGKQGSVRSRDGYTHFLPSPGAQRFRVIGAYYRRASPADPHLALVRGDGTVFVVNVSGTSLGITAPPAGYESGPWNFARVGTTSAEYLYGGIRKTGGQALYRWDGVTATQPTVSFGGKYVTVQANDNRLVLANLNNPDSSSVRFSDAGAPETFGTNNYVTLTPGDGEEITGLGSWREFVYVGKPSKVFVFYGNSVDGTGNPVFNYKTVDAGVGPIGGYASCRGQDGWYFVAKDGVYVMRGVGTPELISEAVSPIFTGSALPFFASSALNRQAFSGVQMGWVNGRLYVAYPSGSSLANDRVLVYDPPTEQWLLWSVPINGLCAFAPSPGSGSVAGGGPEELFFSYSAGANQIGRFSFVPGTYTTDDGTAISSRYRSGFYTVGNSPSAEAVIRESILDGVGSPTFSVSKNFASSLPSSGGGAKASVTLGTSPAYGQGRHRVSQKGQRFSYQIEGTAPWRVTSVVQHVRGVRPAGEKST